MLQKEAFYSSSLALRIPPFVMAIRKDYQDLHTMEAWLQPRFILN